MKKSIYIWSVLLIAFVMSACGKGKQVAQGTFLPPGSGGINPTATPSLSPGVSPTPTPSGTPLPTPPPVSGGATALMVVAGTTAQEQLNLLKTYVGSTLNNPGPVQVNLNARPTSGIFLGTSRIRFYDQQFNQLILHDGSFENGLHTDSGNNVHILTTDSVSGEQVYRILLEDRWGAIIIVIQYATPAHDPSYMFGKVWFRNFNSTAPNPLYDTYCNGGYCWPPNPKAYCWSGIITTGPYDCRNMTTPPAESGTKAFTFLGTIPLIDGHQALGL